MYRRSFLKGVAAIPAASALPRQPLAAPRGTGVFRRVRPSDALWPDRASWQKLNDATGGKLIEVPELFAPCRAAPEGKACADAVTNIHNPFYLGDQPAGTQVSGWLDAWISAPSACAVRAGSAADVAAAVNFAREHRLRLVVKGTGHSYQGTSNAPDSLLVWTRAMNRVTLHDAFVPAGCAGKLAPVPAVTAEAGAVWIDLYDAVTVKAGRYVQGGGCTDVGVAGLIQSGGFGSMSKGFGMAAASLLEAQVVTADGSIRTVNACNDPELFWALKGGGGGSWGVVTSVTLRTHALPQYFGAAWGRIKAHSDEAYRRLVAHFVAYYRENLFNPSWGEQVSFGPDNTLGVSMVCQGLDPRQTAAAWQPFFDWVAAAPRDFSFAEPYGSIAVNPRHWWDVKGNPAMIADPRPGAPAHHGWWKDDQGQVGVFIHGYESLWLPASLLGSGRAALADALFEASRHKKVSLHFNKGLAGASADAIAAARNTATNPAVCEAFALAIIADAGDPAYPALGQPPDRQEARADADRIGAAAAALRKVVDNPGSYVSESNYFNPNWQDAFWGRNYPALRAVKKKYDPDGLFFVHHGVGSEEWSADGFVRLANG